MAYPAITGNTYILVLHIIEQIMTGYYDIVLGLIPVTLVGITAALTVVGVNMTTAVPLAAVVAITLMGHAMFVNAPIETTDEPVDANANSNTSASSQFPVNTD